MLNRDHDGAYLSSMHESMKLLASYIETAEKDLLWQLENDIDQNNQDAARHPNELLFGMAIVLGWFFKKEVGRSIAPMFRANRLTLAVAQYIELAEQHRFDELHALLEKNTDVPANNPSKLLYHSAVALGTVWVRQTGRSLIPVFKKAAEDWTETVEERIGRLFA